MFMSTLALFFVLATLDMQTQETRPVPADSVEIVTRGCVNGRAFTTTPRPEGEGVTRGPDVTGRIFRLAGPPELLDQVAKYNGKLVEAVGIIKKSEITRPSPGSRSGVTVSAPRTDPTRPNSRRPTGSSAVMDLTAIRYLSDACPTK
jgi:hypothetical protein